MKFGALPVAESAGTILAHSLKIGAKTLRKGTVLSAGDILALSKAGIDFVTVAKLAKDDIGEDSAADMLSQSIVGTEKNLRCADAFTGRVNVYAEASGIFEVNATLINKINAVSADISVATLADKSCVAKGALVTTVKIIPYGVPKTIIDEALVGSALLLKPFKIKQASLVLTQTAEMKPSLIEKGQKAVANRLRGLGCDLDDVALVPHDEAALVSAISDARHDLILILTGSATADIDDIGPSAVRLAGGNITRFGMPVDPGNLLFLASLDGRTIIGLPGCARAPALNGADWVLQRVVAGIEVANADIAAMGVGGLLKEIPTRPHPRSKINQRTTKPKIEIIMLAAGGSRRMRGADKLMEDINGVPLLRHCTAAAIAAKLGVVNVVMQPNNSRRNAALKGLGINHVSSNDWANGMAASIRAGMAAISKDCDAVIIALADMPEIAPGHFTKLAAAFDPAKNHEICRAVTEDGAPGLPVLFGRRFFESLENLQGDRGARDIVKEAAEFLVDVPTKGQGAIIDLDTPEEWHAWRLKR